MAVCSRANQNRYTASIRCSNWPHCRRAVGRKMHFLANSLIKWTPMFHFTTENAPRSHAGATVGNRYTASIRCSTWPHTGSAVGKKCSFFSPTSTVTVETKSQSVLTTAQLWQHIWSFSLYIENAPRSHAGATLGNRYTASIRCSTWPHCSSAVGKKMHFLVTSLTWLLSSPAALKLLQKNAPRSHADPALKMH